MGSVWVSPLCIRVSIIFGEIVVQLDGIADLTTGHYKIFS